MNEDLKLRFAPNRNKRYGMLPSLNEEADWADTLDWTSNDYDFHRLFKSLCDRLDSQYRERFGVRIDQLAENDELLGLARNAASWYQQERFSQVLSIYVYLMCTLEHFLGGRANEVLERRSVDTYNLTRSTW